MVKLDRRAFIKATILAMAPGLMRGQSSHEGMTIPTSTRPRLWFNSARLSAAQTWFASNPFTPSGTDYLGHALRYILNPAANVANARTAITYVLTVDPTDADPYRWDGDLVPLVYDWCYNEFTGPERATLEATWDAAAEAHRNDSWGGPGMAENNYYWGFLRTQILWGIARWGSLGNAATLITDALTTRWTNEFVPKSLTEFKGGLSIEGGQYGQYIAYYGVPAFVTTGLLGRDVYGESNFFIEYMYSMVYNTVVSTGRGIELIPYGDDDYWNAGNWAEPTYLPNFALVMAQQYAGTNVAGIARQWYAHLNTHETRPAHRYVLSVDPGGSSAAFTTLPLDFYAGGVGHVISRTSWTDSLATICHMQAGPLGAADGLGHWHDDTGNFQLHRRGRWLTRETVWYNAKTVGVWPSGTTTTPYGASQHNSIMLAGQGRGIPPLNGDTEVTRLHRTDDFIYMVHDQIKMWRNNDPMVVPFPNATRDRPQAVVVIREMLWIKALETLIVFDRLETASAGQEKAMFIHFTNNPTMGANTALHVIGTEALMVTTLLPASPTYNVAAEGSDIGQYRLTITQSGATQQHFLNVLQCRGSSDADLTIAYDASGATHVIDLSHATLGHARVEFNKGMASTGGGCRYNAASLPGAVDAFRTDVQEITIATSGITWEGDDPPAPSTPRSSVQGKARISGKVRLP